MNPWPHVAIPCRPWPWTRSWPSWPLPWPTPPKSAKRPGKTRSLAAKMGEFQGDFSQKRVIWWFWWGLVRFSSLVSETLKRSPFQRWKCGFRQQHMGFCVRIQVRNSNLKTIGHWNWMIKNYKQLILECPAKFSSHSILLLHCSEEKQKNADTVRDAKVDDPGTYELVLLHAQVLTSPCLGGGTVLMLDFGSGFGARSQWFIVISHQNLIWISVKLPVRAGWNASTSSLLIRWLQAIAGHIPLNPIYPIKILVVHR